MNKMINKNLYLRSLNDLMYSAVITAAIAIAIMFMKNNEVDYNINIYFFSAASYNPIDFSLLFIMIFGSFALSNVALLFAKDKKNADYIYSLPYTKGQIYTSKFAAVVTMQLAISIITILFGVIMSSGLLGKITFFNDMVAVLINAMIGSLVVIGAMFLSASITGKGLSTLLLAVFLIIVPALPFISKTNALSGVVSDFYTGAFPVSYSLYSIPNFLNAVSGGYMGFRTLVPNLLTLLIGIGYIVLGYYFFIRRSGELTGNHTKSKGLHLFVMGIAPLYIVYWLLITTSIGNGVIPTELKNVMLFVLLALMFAVLYEVIVNRTLNKVFRCVVVLICSIILASAIHFPTAAKTKYEMERTVEYGEVESINFVFDASIAVNYLDDDKLSYGEYLASSIDITDQETIEYILEKSELSYVGTGNYTPDFQYIKINLNSGKSIYRKIQMIGSYDRTENLNEADIRMIFEKDHPFYDDINTLVPKEYVTFVYGEYWQEGLKNQDAMENIYEGYLDDYSHLGMAEKQLLRLYGQNYLNINIINDIKLKSDIPIGILYVKGRVTNTDIIDICIITKETEQAANRYMQTANDINFSELSNTYHDIEDNTKSIGYSLRLHVLSYDEENQGEALFNLHMQDVRPNVIHAEQKYFIQALKVLLSGDTTAPKAGDEFVKVIFYDELGWQREVFLAISAEQIEEIIKLNEEMNQ